MIGARVWAVVGLSVVVAAVIIALAVLDPAHHAGTIAILVGFLGLAMTNLGVQRAGSDTSDRVDALDRTVRNGGIEGPVKTALLSHEGQTAIRQAVTTDPNDPRTN